jgi:hypothetical protein
MSNKLLLVVALFTMGHISAWFQFNSQFIWDWWKERQMLSVLIYSLPTSFFFILGTKHAVEMTESVWSSRLLGYGVGIIIFSILTYVMMRESVFTPKTLTCVILSIIIILIQVFWK